VICKMD